MGNKNSISNEPWPKYIKEYLVEKQHEYPISFNGKMRFKIPIPNNLSKEEIEKIVLGEEKTIKYLREKKPKKIIIIPGKIVNIVV